jgi:hypothetical protein
MMLRKGYLGGPYDHMNNFITAIRTNGKVTEDAIFGYRAAAPALVCNDSYFKNSPNVLGSGENENVKIINQQNLIIRMKNNLKY